jgi:hypothetical protein
VVRIAAIDPFILRSCHALDTPHHWPNSILGREKNVWLVRKLQRRGSPRSGEDIGRPGLLADGDELQ